MNNPNVLDDYSQQKLQNELGIRALGGYGSIFSSILVDVY